MINGPIFAVGNALALAASLIFLRRGLVKTNESVSALAVVLLSGTLASGLVALVSNDFGKLFLLSWQGYCLLVTASVTHFLLGRYLYYVSIRLIGVNRTTALLRTQLIVSVVAGFVYFHEPLTFSLITGIVFIIAGATLVSINAGNDSTKVSTRGIITGLAASVLFGLSPALIKPVVTEMGSPYAANFITFLSGLMLMAAFLATRRKKTMEMFRNLPLYSLAQFTIGGLFTTLAHLFRFSAIALSPLSVVVPIMSTQPVAALLLSYLVARKVETFNREIVLGIIFVVIGALFLVK